VKAKQQKHELASITLPLLNKMTLQPQQLNNTIQISPGNHVLILNSAADPYVPIAAQHITTGTITLAEDNIASLHEAESKIPSSSKLHHVAFHEYPLKEPPSTIDIALINLLYQPSKAWIIYGLQVASYALKPGARLYVTGAKDRGIITIAKHMQEIFGNIETLLISKGHRLISSHNPPQTASPSPLRGRFVPSEPAKPVSRRGGRGEEVGRGPLGRPRPGLRPANNSTSQNIIEQFTLDSPQITEHNDKSPTISSLLNTLYSPSVFAHGNLDEGTRLLIEALEVQPTDEALDIGCGAGYIGLHIARLATSGHVTMLDVSLATVALARQNIAASGLTNIIVLPSDGAQAVLTQRFDLVVTNPPFHHGGIQTTAIAERFIQQASQVLRPNGRFYLVANRFLKYEPTLQSHFKTINEIAGNTRYKILLALHQ
jgi:16S rRNA G1207 methylase RsmC